jgi:TetR/AcrR family transcriptional regulator
MRPTNPRNKAQILAKAIPLFARQGFSGVSIRDVAKKAGMTPAALYHHFPDKQTLYKQALKQAFSDKGRRLTDVLKSTNPPEERLASFITRLCEVMSEDPDFFPLVQREMMDGNEARLKALAEDVLHDLYLAIADLSRELSSDLDSHLMAISMVGLVMFHVESRTLRMYLPGGEMKHNEPEVIARHITNLLLQGLKRV